MDAANPIAEYKERKKLSVTDLAKELKISKGHASDLVAGKERPGRKTALRMQELTGKPWWKFVTPPEATAQ